MPDRASPEFLQQTLGRIFTDNPNAQIFGVSADFAPQTYNELMDIVEENRKTKCLFHSEIDGFMELLMADVAPDEIVRTMPFDPVHKILALIYVPEEK